MDHHGAYRLSAVHSKLQKFDLYETRVRYYLVGRDNAETRYRILKIERETTELQISEDPTEYSPKEYARLLRTLREGNKSIGGLTLVGKAYGIVGFIRFLEGYYMILVTKRSPVGSIGGHFIYKIDDTSFIKLAPSSDSGSNAWSAAETRYRNLFSCVDLTKDFYFAPTYDLTHTLQYNMCHGENEHGVKEMVHEDLAQAAERAGDEKAKAKAQTQAAYAAHEATQSGLQYQENFCWNHFLLEEIKQSISNHEWLTPIIHGFFAQVKLSIFSRLVNVTLLARRSRLFAGPRFLKRGVNDNGDVANDVETEQIVHEAGMGTSSVGHFSSLVQVRGSIPLFWAQEGGLTSPKPAIFIQRYDPYYSASQLQFEKMFRRYGAPCVVLNLVKHIEKVPRENILRKEFLQAVTYLNKSLPHELRIRYVAWDLNKAAKGKSQKHINVFHVLHQLSEWVIAQTGFFHSGRQVSRNGEVRRPPNAIQRGVLRTNCVDCLDRTNLAMFCMGKCALGHQLHRMGIIQRPEIDPDWDVLHVLTEMYEAMGDRLALQYAGSQVIPSSYKDQKGTYSAAKQSRAVLQSIKRYYSNTFTDAEKQDAINLFLGNFVPEKGKLNIWELDSDYYLHQEDVTSVRPDDAGKPRSAAWWEQPLAAFEAENIARTSEELTKMAADALEQVRREQAAEREEEEPGANRTQPTLANAGEVDAAYIGDAFEQYYKPQEISSFDRLLEYDFNKALVVRRLKTMDPDDEAARQRRFKRWLKMAGQNGSGMDPVAFTDIASLMGTPQRTHTMAPPTGGSADVVETIMATKPASGDAAVYETYATAVSAQEEEQSREQAAFYQDWLKLDTLTE